MSETKLKIFLLFTTMLNVDNFFDKGGNGKLDFRKYEGLEYSIFKELYNFHLFLAFIGESDLVYSVIPGSKRRDCIYSNLDDALVSFCYKKNINIEDCLLFIKALCLFSLTSLFVFARYNLLPEKEVSLDVVINSELRYIKIFINWIGFRVKEISVYDPLRFLKVCVFIRYFFFNKNFKIIFKNHGWVILFNKDYSLLFEKILYINFDIKIKPDILSFNGKSTFGDILDNKNFNISLGIEKFNQIREVLIGDNNFLSTKCNVNFILDIINYLNSSKMTINKFALDLAYDVYSRTEVYKTNPDKLLSGMGINDLRFFLNFNKGFYLSYILDTRTRTYCKNIPLNPQLDKVARVFLISEDKENFVNININFLKNNLNVFSLNEIYTCLNHIELLTILGDSKIEKCNIKSLTSIIIDENNIKDFMEEVLFLQQLMDVSIRYGEFNKDKKEIIKNGGSFLNSESENYKNEEIDEYIELVVIKKGIKSDEKGLDLNGFNDASASVIQLLVAKMFISDIKTLKIANILENDLDFKDMYDFVLKNISDKRKDLKKGISRSLIKRIIMPGIYGQKIPKMISECENILKNYSGWENLNKQDKIEVILDINKECGNILKNLGLDILKYLELTKKLVKTEKIYYGSSMLNLPIIIGKSENIDRKKILKDLLKEKYKNNEKKVKKLKEKLNEDDKNYIRKNIKLGENEWNKRYIKIRIKLKNKKIDSNALKNGLCPSSIHSEDASILLNIIKECSNFKIKVIPIHDSVGSKIYFSSIIKTIYKKEFINYLNHINSKKEFPINLIIEKKIDIEFENEIIIRKKKFKERREEILKGIRGSSNIFN